MCGVGEGAYSRDMGRGNSREGGGGGRIGHLVPLLEVMKRLSDLAERRDRPRVPLTKETDREVRSLGLDAACPISTG
jgi:hypothetical protein